MKIDLEKIANEARLAQKAIKDNPGSLSAYKKDEEMKEIGLSGELRDASMEEYENFKLKKAEFDNKIEEVGKKIKEAHGEETITLLAKELAELAKELTSLNVAFYGESKESMSDKAYLEEKLKEGNYYEHKPILASLSEKLLAPTDLKEFRNEKVMTEAEITKGQKFFTMEEAMGLAVKHSKEGRGGLIWYEDGGALCHVNVIVGGRIVYVNKHFPAYEWDEGITSFFRN